MILVSFCVVVIVIVVVDIVLFSFHAGPFKSGRSTQRLYSVPDEFDTQTQSNGDIPRKTPFLPPPSALSTNQNRDNSAQCPPPKPPRTGSTSPSAFLSLDRGVELEEPFEESDEEYYDQEGEEDMSQSSGGAYNFKPYYHVARPASGQVSKCHCGSNLEICGST